MRYLICVGATVLFVLFGFSQCKDAYDAYNQIGALSAQNLACMTELDSAKAERDTVAEQLHSKDIAVANSNLEIAQAVSLLASATINSITGEYLDETGFQSVVSVTNVEDVEFFTADVQYMNFFLSSSNIEHTLDALQHANLCISGVDVDYESSSVYVRIPTVFVSSVSEEGQ